MVRLTFSPEGVLFVGDNIGSAVFAYPIGGAAPAAATAPLEVDGIDARIARLLRVPLQQVTINGLAVNPVSREVYLSVTRGRVARDRQGLASCM